MKLSIVIPAYQAGNYLPRLLDSISGQDSIGVEFVFVDDGSTDRTGEILDDFCASRENSHVLHLDNGGVSRARNAGLSVATGEWIGFADADDEFLPNAFTAIRNAIEGCRNSPTIVSFAWEWAEPTRREVRGIGRIDQSWEDIFSAILSKNYWAAPWAKVFPRAFVERERFEPGMSFEEDVLFFLRTVVRNRATVHFDPHIIYRYRVRPDSLTFRNDWRANAHRMNEAVMALAAETGFATGREAVCAAYCLETHVIAARFSGRVPDHSDLEPYLELWSEIRKLPVVARRHLGFLPLYLRNRKLGRLYLRCVLWRVALGRVRQRLRIRIAQRCGGKVGGA